MKRILFSVAVAALANFPVVSCWAQQAAASSSYPSYPTGFSVSAGVNVFHRDMRSDSGWRYAFDSQREYHSPAMGVSGALGFAYQASQHWGVAIQGGWIPEQKIKSLDAGSGFVSGDYKKLSTRWTALLVCARLKMDYRYYFTAKFGAAYADHVLDTQALSVISRSKLHVVVPTAAASIEYQLTNSWLIGAQYQLMLGRKDWQQDWTGSATRIPALQQFGVIVGYVFSA